MRSVSGKLNIYLVIIFSALMLCGSVYISHAQDAVKFNIRFKLEIEKGDLKNALVTIYKNGVHYRVIDPSGGKYKIDLELGADYTIVCTKMGYVSKTLAVDTHVPIGREKDDFAKFNCTVSLDPQPEDAIMSYSQPVGKIKYNQDVNDFDFDKNYTSSSLQIEKKVEEKPAPPPPAPPAPKEIPKEKPKEKKPKEESKPIPIVVEKKEELHEKEKPKPKPPVQGAPEKKSNKNITEQTIQDSRKKITIINVNIDGNEYVYRKEEWVWGGIYFYKNNVFITERTFALETE
jgi:hypothetical protein